MEVKPKTKVISKQVIPKMPVFANPRRFLRTGYDMEAQMPTKADMPTIAPRVDSETHW